MMMVHGVMNLINGVVFNLSVKTKEKNKNNKNNKNNNKNKKKY